MWAAAPAAFFFTSTSIEAFDDLNLQFGSRPSPLALSLTLSISSGGRHRESQEAKQSFCLSRPAVSHLAVHFFLITRASFVTPLLLGLLLLSRVTEETHETMIRIEYAFLPSLVTASLVQIWSWQIVLRSTAQYFSMPSFFLEFNSSNTEN